MQEFSKDENKNIIQCTSLTPNDDLNISNSLSRFSKK